LIAVSRRHAGAVLAMAALAAVPLGWHAIAAPVADPCRDPHALLASQRIGGGRVGDRRPDKAGRRGAGWIGGEIPSPTADVNSMIFRVSRGFDPFAFYGSGPLTALDPDFVLDERPERVDLDAGGENLPVYWLEDAPLRDFRLRAHVYVLGSRPVAHPFPAGLAVWPQQLRNGTLPVTLFMFRAVGRASAADAMRRDARDWLRAAWQHYREMCG
jgi:hypothetical protein